MIGSGLQEAQDDKGEVMNPYWTDHCEHCKDGRGIYVGSFSIGSGEESQYDVYLYQDGIIGDSVCIRYGEEGHEYISPGSLEQVRETVFNHFIPSYSMAYALIMNKKIRDGESVTPTFPSRHKVSDTVKCLDYLDVYLSEIEPEVSTTNLVEYAKDETKRIRTFLEGL